MRVLVFGAEGMLGAALVHHLRDKSVITVCGTSLSEAGADGLIGGIDISKPDDVEKALDLARPDVIVNCAGIVKSECSRQEPDRVLAVNARAPHVMAEAARRHGCRLVHISTDCVFSGRRGSYREADQSDAEDLYGQSKAAGEIHDRPDCLTLRTSFIGRDPRRHRGLLEWLLQQATRGAAVPGWERALWSGLSAPELARAIEIALFTRNLSGLYHVAGPVISKADLLETLVRELGLKCHVERVGGEAIDRTLDGSRFSAATNYCWSDVKGWVPPSWAKMAKEFFNA